MTTGDFVYSDDRRCGTGGHGSAAFTAVGGTNRKEIDGFEAQ